MTSPNTIIADMQAENAELRRQRDELLEALELARPFINAWPQCREYELVIIDSAISSVKGNTK